MLKIHGALLQVSCALAQVSLALPKFFEFLFQPNEKFIIFASDTYLYFAMTNFKFSNLVVYQRGLDLVEYVYLLMKKFPSDERYALCDQLRRAVVSVPSNIAEGMGRASDKEKIHFLEISYGSLMEVFCQMEIAKRLGYISETDFKLLRSKIFEVVRPLTGLHTSLLKKDASLRE